MFAELLPLQGEPAAALSAWLLAIAVQSTLWIGLAWAGLRALPAATPALREALWKAALLASLLGPSVQAAFDLQPWGGRWALGSAAEARPALVPQSSLPAMAVDETWRQALTAPPSVESAPRAARPAAAPPATTATETARPRPPAVNVPWTTWLANFWPFAALAGLAYEAWRSLHFRWHLRRRQHLESGDVHRELAVLAARAGWPGRVRLSSSPRLVAPISFGCLRPEICLPPRTLSALGGEQRACLLGHELAHHLRADPAWLLAFRVLERLFFFQPLLRLARRQVFDAAEERCDAWAAAHAGGGVAMASCLAEVAGWLHEGHRPVPAAAMARPGAPLTRRIERLLDPAAPEPAPRRARFGWAVVPLPLLLAPWLMPGFAAAAAPTPPAAEPPRVQPASASSTLAAVEPQTANAMDPLQFALLRLDQQLAALRGETDACAADLAQRPELDCAVELARVRARLDRLQQLRGRVAALLAEPEPAPPFSPELVDLIDPTSLPELETP